jgi:hypothetical protein
MSTQFGGDGAGDGDDAIDPPFPQHLQQLEQTLANDSTTSRAKSLPATTNVNTTPKRSASVPPASQPDLKKAKLSFPTDVKDVYSGSLSIRHAYILSKRRALAQPLDQPDSKKARVFIPADGRGGSGGFLPAQFADILSKRWALAPVVDQPDVKRVWMFVPSDRSSGRGVFVDVLSPSYPEVLRALKAAYGLAGGNTSKPEQMEKDGVGLDVKGKVDEDKVDKNKHGKKKVDNNKVDSDSDVVEIIEAKVVTRR